MSRTGSTNCAAFKDTMLVHEAMEYIGTLIELSASVDGSYEKHLHEKNSYDVSLEKRLSVVFPGPSSIEVGVNGPGQGGEAYTCKKIELDRSPSASNSKGHH